MFKKNIPSEQFPTTGLEQNLLIVNVCSGRKRNHGQLELRQGRAQLLLQVHVDGAASVTGGLSGILFFLFFTCEFVAQKLDNVSFVSLCLV